MRILGYIDHPVLKITVFKTDTRLAVKFEDRFLEQTYKFRMQENLNSLHEVRALIEGEMLDKVIAQMQQMHTIHQQGLEKLMMDTKDDLPNII